MTPAHHESAGHPYVLEPRVARVLGFTAATGAVAFVVGAIIVPERAWAGLLVGFHYTLGVALAGGVFLALLACSGSRWAAALRRVPEAMSAAIPVAAIPAIVLLFGLQMLFPWARPHGPDDPHAHVIAAKHAYLNPLFLCIRTIVVLVVLTWGARMLRNAAPGAARVRWGAAFMAMFGVLYSIVSVDWLQSLEPWWSSTAFAIITLAGLVLSGLAAAIVLAVHLRRRGAWRGVLHADHVHDLAKLLFGFSLFWSYVQYCQFMLIWYTNIPEETVWYAARMRGMWWSTGLVSFALNGVIPFVVLLFRRARRDESTVLRVAGIVLVGRLADLSFHVGPPLLGPSPWPSPWEVLPVVGLVALLALVVLRAISRGPSVHADEPGLEQSLHYHQ
ncbi:MAG: hypothetical protein K8T90_15000 [Planctomycetes bacterium]|nr:hypothetical protein [Planctomycetota bacterium]